MAIETLNMKTVPLSRVVKQVKMQLATEDYSPVVVIGKSGIGKTECMAELAHELEIGFKELRLSHYQESDLVGLPYIEGGKTKHAETDLLPDSNDPNQGILLLDEITSAPKSMRSAVYQLMDSSRKLGQYVLPKRWLIVCCGNGPDDGGDFRGIEPALMSRGRCMRVEENLEAWKAWAIRKGIHPIVVAYISFSPDSLHVMDLDKPNDMIACPRNWVKLSTQITNMEKMAGGIITDEEDLEFSACSCVGEKCGPSFVAFYRHNKSVVNTDDIIEGKVDPSVTDTLDTEVMYIIIQNIISAVKKELNEGKVASGYSDKALTRLTNVINWVVAVGRRSRLDFAVMTLQDLKNNVPDFASLVLSDFFMENCGMELLKFASENDIALIGSNAR